MTCESVHEECSWKTVYIAQNLRGDLVCVIYRCAECGKVVRERD